MTRASSPAQERLLHRPGFTLIELLVVVGIIGILASLLLPSLGKGKQRARLTQCMNNLRQQGIGVAMYLHDNRDTLPPAYVRNTNGLTGWTMPSLGGRDPRPDVAEDLPAHYIRPLFPYLKPSEVFHCPEDHGALVLIDVPKAICLKPTSWEVAGSSYMYNCCGFDRARLEPEDKYFNLAGKQIGWVPNPSSFILMYEPPARSFTIIFRGAVMRVFQNWHYSTQTTDWPEIYLPSDPSKFIAPVLFVDGHVASFDFSSSIRPDPRHVFEPTKNWTWYKPAPQSAPTLGRGD